MKFEEGYLLRRNPNLIEAMWCIDSESGKEVLVNLRTNEIIAYRVNGEIKDPRIEGAPHADC